MKMNTRAAIVSLALALIALAASAQNRVFVSAAHGDDSADCSIATPCRFSFPK